MEFSPEIFLDGISEEMGGCAAFPEVALAMISTGNMWAAIPICNWWAVSLG